LVAALDAKTQDGRKRATVREFQPFVKSCQCDNFVTGAECDENDTNVSRAPGDVHAARNAANLHWARVQYGGSVSSPASLLCAGYFAWGCF
jgi:hypothetical protein